MPPNRTESTSGETPISIGDLPGRGEGESHACLYKLHQDEHRRPDRARGCEQHDPPGEPLHVPDALPLRGGCEHAFHQEDNGACKADVLPFPIDPSVPFTNNLAERDLRMMNVRQKTSGCFRTATGAENLATLRTVLSTARKQGWSLIETLEERPDALIAKIKIA